MCAQHVGDDVGNDDDDDCDGYHYNCVSHDDDNYENDDDDDDDAADDDDDNDDDSMCRLYCAQSLASSVYSFEITTHIHCNRDSDSGEQFLSN